MAKLMSLSAKRAERELETLIDLAAMCFRYQMKERKKASLFTSNVFSEVGNGLGISKFIELSQSEQLMKVAASLSSQSIIESIGNPSSFGLIAKSKLHKQPDNEMMEQLFAHLGTILSYTKLYALKQLKSFQPSYHHTRIFIEHLFIPAGLHLTQATLTTRLKLSFLKGSPQKRAQKIKVKLGYSSWKGLDCFSDKRSQKTSLSPIREKETEGVGQRLVLNFQMEFENWELLGRFIQPQDCIKISLVLPGNEFVGCCRVYLFPLAKANPSDFSFGLPFEYHSGFKSKELQKNPVLICSVQHKLPGFSSFSEMPVYKDPCKLLNPFSAETISLPKLSSERIKAILDASGFGGGVSWDSPRHEKSDLNAAIKDIFEWHQIESLQFNRKKRTAYFELRDKLVEIDKNRKKGNQNSPLTVAMEKKITFKMQKILYDKGTDPESKGPSSQNDQMWMPADLELKETEYSDLLYFYYRNWWDALHTKDSQALKKRLKVLETKGFPFDDYLFLWKDSGKALYYKIHVQALYEEFKSNSDSAFGSERSGWESKANLFEQLVEMSNEFLGAELGNLMCEVCEFEKTQKLPAETRELLVNLLKGFLMVGFMINAMKSQFFKNISLVLTRHTISVAYKLVLLQQKSKRSRACCFFDWATPANLLEEEKSKKASSPLLRESAIKSFKTDEDVLWVFLSFALHYFPSIFCPSNKIFDQPKKQRESQKEMRKLDTCLGLNFERSCSETCISPLDFTNHNFFLAQTMLILKKDLPIEARKFLLVLGFGVESFLLEFFMSIGAKFLGCDALWLLWSVILLEKTSKDENFPLKLLSCACARLFLVASPKISHCKSCEEVSSLITFSGHVYNGPITFLKSVFQLYQKHFPDPFLTFMSSNSKNGNTTQRLYGLLSALGSIATGHNGSAEPPTPFGLFDSFSSIAEVEEFYKTTTSNLRLYSKSFFTYGEEFAEYLNTSKISAFLNKIELKSNCKEILLSKERREVLRFPLVTKEKIYFSLSPDNFGLAENGSMTIRFQSTKRVQNFTITRKSDSLFKWDITNEADLRPTVTIEGYNPRNRVGTRDNQGNFLAVLSVEKLFSIQLNFKSHHPEIITRKILKFTQADNSETSLDLIFTFLIHCNSPGNAKNFEKIQKGPSNHMECGLSQTVQNKTVKYASWSKVVGKFDFIN